MLRLRHQNLAEAIPGIKSRAVRWACILPVFKLIPLLALVVAGLSWLAPSVRTITAAPLALFGALVVATALYVLIQAISVTSLPELAGSERALVDVADVLMGPAGAVLLTVGVVFSVGGNIAGTMISAPRLTYALALDGNLPGWFGQVHERYRTPANSIIFFTVLTLLLSVVGSFLWLAAMSALVRVLIYMACISAMPRLRSAASHAGEPGFRLPGGWTIPLIAFAACGLLLVQISLDSILATAAVLLVGTAVFWGMRWRG